ncbi:uncharacterized protein bub1ba isoform X1 [Anabas testudineus]|uniref:uncharacterized protein bub1ba isoform X1 n=1 Tax=Anabas testudineus TaxID=64144 RepID=UPI000E45B9BA|nr:uncharacterized protein bub1ba isoform X1 [Anabas testudineus]
MAEGLMLQVGSSVYRPSANRCESLQTCVSRGMGPQNEGGDNLRSEYCKELLMRGGVELSFEELRAERCFQNRDGQMDEKLRHLTDLREQLTQELEEKNRILLTWRMSQQQVLDETSSFQHRDSDKPLAAASFQIYDDSQSQPDAAQPAGGSEPSPNELLDDVFLRPDERGLCLKVQCPRPGAVVPSGLSQQSCSQTGDATRSGPCPSSKDRRRGTTEDLQTLVHSRPPSVPQNPLSSIPEKLSPIQETSVEASSLTSLGGLSAGNCSPLEKDQDQGQEEMGHSLSPAVGGVVDPCDPNMRWWLLDLCDVSSSADLHSECGPLPAVEENSCLQLGGAVYLIFSRVVGGGSFSVYKGATGDDYVFIKVDSCSVPWDFHQFNRLKKGSSSTAALPLVSCFLFLDGCITVYTSPLEHMFTELSECDPCDLSVGHKAIGLLQLVSQLHSCRLLHTALQPHILNCSHRGFLSPDQVFPVDWSSSVDLDLQQDVKSVQQLPSAQTYISLGLLDPTAPPELVPPQYTCSSCTDFTSFAEIVTPPTVLPVRWTWWVWPRRSMCS